MDILRPVLGIIGVLFIGVISPGPSFVFIAQRSMALTRNDGISASIGMGLGGVFFAVLALLGLHLIMTAFPLIYIVVRVIGGLYLVYLAYKIWKGSKSMISVARRTETGQAEIGKSLVLGLVTQISNPKTAIVYSSVFATFLPGHIDWRFTAALVPAVFLVEASWYCFVAVVLSSNRPREIYGNFKKAIDRVAAALLGGLGGKLVLEGLFQARLRS